MGKQIPEYREYLDRAMDNYRFIMAQKRPNRDRLRHYLTSMACSIKLAQESLASRKVVKKLKDCDAEIWRGPGHQSHTKCAMKGPHDQHYADGYYWTKKKAFSGFFDESPQYEGEARIRKSKRSK